MIEAVRSGGRDGLIGENGRSVGNKGLVDGHGHGHEQNHEHAHSCLSSVAAPRGSSPVVHSHENAVLTTTPTTTNTTTNIAHNPTAHIDHNIDALDMPIPDLLISRRPHDDDQDHDHIDGTIEPSSLMHPTRSSPGLPPVGDSRLQVLSGLITNPPTAIAGGDGEGAAPGRAAPSVESLT